MHGAHGWRSANALAGEALIFKPSEWRKDSRLELIFDGPQSEDKLNERMRGCRL
jgi:hypothetical protein